MRHPDLKNFNVLIRFQNARGCQQRQLSRVIRVIVPSVTGTSGKSKGLPPIQAGYIYGMPVRGGATLMMPGSATATTDPGMRH
ncbi:hypothetical protein [Acetobacter malorum]|uniref:hypothetical protein n=1 Tax=Acetobacter malorum TaxID=178901 RepID=UPI0039E83EC0